MARSIHDSQFTVRPDAPLYAERQLQEPQELLRIDLPATTIHLQLGQAGLFEDQQSGRFLEKRVLPGQLTIRPAGSTLNVRWGRPVEMLGVVLPTATLVWAAQGLAYSDRLSLRFGCGIEDPDLQALLLLIERDATGQRPGGRLYSDSLAIALVALLLKRYGNREQTRFRANGSLSSATLRQILSYVDESIGANLSIAALAAVAGLSPFHFSRLFRHSTGESVHQFVLNRRIARAQKLLENRNLTLAEVAHATGFAHQSHMTAVFRKHLGTTPNQYRSRKAISADR